MPQFPQSSPQVPLLPSHCSSHFAAKHGLGLLHQTNHQLPTASPLTEKYNFLSKSEKLPPLIYPFSSPPFPYPGPLSVPEPVLPVLPVLSLPPIYHQQTSQPANQPNSTPPKPKIPKYPYPIIPLSLPLKSPPNLYTQPFPLFLPFLLPQTRREYTNLNYFTT